MTEEVKKSAGFAFPGDVSFTLNMTRPSLRRSNATVAIPKIGVWAKIYRHSEAKPKPPRQVAPLSATLRVPPLPLQRESILPEGWFSAGLIHKTKSRNARKNLAFRLFNYRIKTQNQPRDVPFLYFCKLRLRPNDGGRFYIFQGRRNC